MALVTTRMGVSLMSLTSVNGSIWAADTRGPARRWGANPEAIRGNGWRLLPRARDHDSDHSRSCQGGEFGTEDATVDPFTARLNVAARTRLCRRSAGHPNGGRPSPVGGGSALAYMGGAHGLSRFGRRNAGRGGRGRQLAGVRSCRACAR